MDFEKRNDYVGKDGKEKICNLHKHGTQNEYIDFYSAHFQLVED